MTASTDFLEQLCEEEWGCKALSPDIWEGHRDNSLGAACSFILLMIQILHDPVHGILPEFLVCGSQGHIININSEKPRLGMNIHEGLLIVGAHEGFFGLVLA